MATWVQNGKGWERRSKGEQLLFEAVGENAVRVRATKNACFTGENWALEGAQPGEIRFSELPEGGARLQSGKLSILVEPDGDVTYCNQKGETLLHEQWRVRSAHMHPVSALEIAGREFIPIPGGDFSLRLRFDAFEGEKLFGMGQYQDGCLDKKGCVLELAQRNSQSSVPFVVSSRGYGFLWNNPAVGRVTFGKNRTEWESESSKELDFWITAGDTPAEIEEAYASVTGTVPMMPEYGMGFWQCKLRYRTQEELLEVAREYKRRGLPISVIVLDFFHWPYQGDWKFDPEEFPDPDAMIAELKGMGIELMVSVWPMVDKLSENYREMAERGLLIRTERGVPYGMDFCGDTIAYDATNPEARDFVWNVIKKNYYDRGVRIFWLDEAEPEYKVYDFDHYRYYKGSALQVGNEYPVQYARNFYEGMERAGQKNIVNLLRCAWAGSQKYGALVWSGDIDTTFTTLREQFGIGLSMAMAGIPWWTTDIGGFDGGDQNDPSYRELLVRWFQFGAFCPVFRLHGNRRNGERSLKPNKAATGGPNEVWSYGDEAYEILTYFLRLRERLRPYIREAMLQAHEKGTPVIRPLFYEFPEDRKAWDNEDSFLFGSDILVCPVMELGQRERGVYLPAGCCWKDAWSGETFEGGREILAAAPLARLPLYVREGKELPIRE